MKYIEIAQIVVICKFKLKLKKNIPKIKRDKKQTRNHCTFYICAQIILMYQ